MSTRDALSLLLLTVLAAFSTGCLRAPGKPGLSEALRPEQVLDFPTLYKGNCAACHGEQGQRGASLSLANPKYLAFAGAANIERITANGVPYSLMPAFSKQAGGSLTNAQISILAHGMVAAWADPHVSRDSDTPAYASSLPGDREKGSKSFQSKCARCHGTDGMGLTTKQLHTGSLIDPSYLALVSDQNLRSTIISGRPGDGMPAYSSDQAITNVVAWLGSYRSPTPGQPYPRHP